jgi:hypothetical protein
MYHMALLKVATLQKQVFAALDKASANTPAPHITHIILTNDAVTHAALTQ